MIHADVNDDDRRDADGEQGAQQSPSVNEELQAKVSRRIGDDGRVVP